MPDKDDAPRDPPPAEQLKILWRERAIKRALEASAAANRNAWRLWMAVIWPVCAMAVTVAVTIWGWRHGGKP